MSSPFGALEKSEYIVIDQTTNFMESCCKFLGCCCADFENVYNITYGKDSKPSLIVKEESGCMSRMFCNPNHSLVLKVSSNGQDVMEIDKPFRCCCPAIFPCFMKEATIRRLNPDLEIGYIKQPCFAGGFSPHIDVYDKKGGEKVGQIKGPCCCLGGFCSSNFTLHDKKGQEHAKIKRDGVAQKGIIRSAATTSDRYELTFEDSTIQLDDKLRLIATTLFLDYLFFEGETDCICILCTCPPQLWFKVCDLYCCGELIPLRFKCCIQEAVKAATTGV